MNKAFFFDMDGTIVDVNSNIKPKTIEALAEARSKGHKLAIATGRPHADIIRDLKKEWFDYLIANNGAYFYDVKEDKFTFNGTLSKQIALDMLSRAKKAQSMFAVHCNGQAYRIDFKGRFADTDINNDPNGKRFVFYPEEFVLEMIDKHEIAQASLRDDPDAVERMAIEYKEKFKDVQFHVANGIYLDANPKGVTKLMGVNAVLEKENISIENAICFGDSGNDLEMVKAAGIGIAMGNGNETIKQAADVVIGDNNTNAIAKQVRALI